MQGPKKSIIKHDKKLLDKFKEIITLGIRISRESQNQAILTDVLLAAIDILNVEGGSMYTFSEHQAMFHIFCNRKLNKNINDVNELYKIFGSIALYDARGNPNAQNVIAYSLLNDDLVVINDVKKTKRFNLKGIYEFDRKFNYKTHSLLTVPLKNHKNEMIGGFQLVNRLDDETGELCNFSLEDQTLMRLFASFLAIIMTQNSLIEAEKHLFNSFLQLLAKIVDHKSQYTSRHCTYVPIISGLIAHAVKDAKEGHYKNTHLTDEDIYEIQVASWLHDCGKLSIPDYILDKSVKLEKLTDRIVMIDLRYEIIRRDILHNSRLSQDERDEQLRQLKEEVEYLHSLNQSQITEVKVDKQRLQEIAQTYRFHDGDGNDFSLISPQDIEHLQIERGTLTEEEKEIVRSHVRRTKEMLMTLPFPEHLAKVPMIASAHHEQMDGSGYHLGLKGKSEIPLGARILAIADIFEALTCSDRPYKPALPLSKTLAIMRDMRDHNKIDSDLFELFITKKLYLQYAKEHLKPEQIDID